MSYRSGLQQDSAQDTEACDKAEALSLRLAPKSPARTQGSRQKSKDPDEQRQLVWGTRHRRHVHDWVL